MANSSHYCYCWYCTFLYLLSRYTDVKAQRDLAKVLVTLNEEEIKIGTGEFQHRPSGLEFQNPTHFYSLDIDLFGRGSFFNSLIEQLFPKVKSD